MQDSNEPLVVVDLAVPRDVEAAARDLHGVLLWDIDDVQRLAAATLDERRRELPRARSIVAAEARRFEMWHAGLEAEPLVRELRYRAEVIRRRELERMIARSPDLDASEIRRLESVTRSLVNRLLHEPTLRIRRAGATASRREIAPALDQLSSCAQMFTRLRGRGASLSLVCNGIYLGILSVRRHGHRPVDAPRKDS